MWSRRAQEYETKIFSGEPIKIAEVVRDLFRKNSQSDERSATFRFLSDLWQEQRFLVEARLQR